MACNMSYVLLIVCLLLIPYSVGNFILKIGNKQYVHVGESLLYGYFLLWGSFEVVAVPVILLEKKLEDIIRIYGVIIVILFITSLFFQVLYFKRAKKKNKTKHWRKLSAATKLERGILMIIFFGLLLFQMYSNITMAYSDGDTAFYLPTTITALANGSMYQVNAYTGFSSSLDYRHALAPFPIWIAMIARISGLHGAIMMQTVLPCVLILLAYVAMGSLMRILLGEEKKEAFWYAMILIEVITLFANYSLYTQGTFLLTRTAQGKAVLSSVVLPGLLVLLYKYLQETGRGHKWAVGLVLLSAMLAACLCSTLGTFLGALCVAMTALIYMIDQRKMTDGIKMGLFCIPSVIMALLYFFIG